VCLASASAKSVALFAMLIWPARAPAMVRLLSPPQTAVAVIFASRIRPVGGVVDVLVFTLLVHSAYLTIIAGFAPARDRVGVLVDAVFGWIKTHLRGSAIGVFAFFGIVLRLEGLTALS
jgi:hypothetical protein